MTLSFGKIKPEDTLQLLVHTTFEIPPEDIKNASDPEVEDAL